MGFFESIVRPVLFSLDAEVAHNLGMRAIRTGLVKSRPSKNTSPIELCGIEFRNKIGLAAGFDKDGLALNQWKNLGFGFVEVGTVTRFPQPGNAKPRLFRYPNEKAIINRMGFNNLGADALAHRLSAARPGIPVGANIGKSKVTPIEEAASDYAYSYRLLAPLVDYVVVNVSSPNTPGLRGLQEKGPLEEILKALKEIDSEKPLFVKIAPDLNESELSDIVTAVEDLDLAGIVATNTTLDRSTLLHDPNVQGGLSGAPLTSLSNQVLRFLRQNLSSKRVLIGVGGIMTSQDAKNKFEIGADLIQVYSGWIYGGPNFVPCLLESV